MGALCYSIKVLLSGPSTLASFAEVFTDGAKYQRARQFEINEKSQFVI